MSVFIIAALGVNPPAATGAYFPNDVPATYWAARWIEEMARRGITVGCAPGWFCPEMAVPRDQMAVFVVRAWNYPY